LLVAAARKSAAGNGWRTARETQDCGGGFNPGARAEGRRPDSASCALNSGGSCGPGAQARPHLAAYTRYRPAAAREALSRCAPVACRSTKRRAASRRCRAMLPCSRMRGAAPPQHEALPLVSQRRRGGG